MAQPMGWQNGQTLTGGAEDQCQISILSPLASRGGVSGSRRAVLEARRDATHAMA